MKHRRMLLLAVALLATSTSGFGDAGDDRESQDRQGSSGGPPSPGEMLCDGFDFDASACNEDDRCEWVDDLSDCMYKGRGELEISCGETVDGELGTTSFKFVGDERKRVTIDTCSSEDNVDNKIILHHHEDDGQEWFETFDEDECVFSETGSNYEEIVTIDLEVGTTFEVVGYERRSNGLSVKVTLSCVDAPAATDPPSRPPIGCENDMMGCDPPIDLRGPGCVDDPMGWEDSEHGDDCEFYATDTTSEETTCFMFGDANFDDAGNSARDACCVCGGGMQVPVQVFGAVQGADNEITLGDYEEFDTPDYEELTMVHYEERTVAPSTLYRQKEVKYATTPKDATPKTGGGLEVEDPTCDTTCDCIYVGTGTTLHSQFLCQKDTVCYNLVDDWCAADEHVCDIPK